MAVSLSPKAQKVFFVKLFGDHWTEAYIQPLLKKGVELNVGFAGITATFNGKTYSCSLPVSTTTLMSNPSSPLNMSAVTAIEKFVDSLSNSIYWGGMGGGGAGAVPPINIVGVSGETFKVEAWGAGGSGGGGSGGGTSATSGTTVSVGGGVAGGSYGGGGGGGKPDVFSSMAVPAEMLQPLSQPPKPKAKPTASIVKLQDAQAIGQKVLGTSSGSIYTVMALSERVKLAARINGQALSIRAEFNNATDAEKEALLKVGMKATGKDYYSVHMDAQSVPVGRIVGAFLMDCEITFNEQIHNIKELK